MDIQEIEITDPAFADYLTDMATGLRAVVPETTEHIYSASDGGTPMISARDFLLAIMLAYAQDAARFPSNQHDLTDKIKAALGCEAASNHLKSLVDDVSQSVVELWESGKLR